MSQQISTLSATPLNVDSDGGIRRLQGILAVKNQQQCIVSHSLCLCYRSWPTCLH